MAKYSVPGINFQETDNTIRSNSVPGLGIGAIVLKSNKGPVNQRVLTTSFDNFTQIYGEPENLDDYGHFAAENYLAVSNQLLCVRATMGDEGYAQIQYPYTDADINDTYLSKDTSEFKYINNEDDSQLKLIGPLDTGVTVSALTAKGQWQSDNFTSAFALKQKAQFAKVQDLISDTPASIAVYKTIASASGDALDPAAVIVDNGTYVEFASKVGYNGEVTKKFDDLILTSGAWTDGGIPADNFEVKKNPVVVTVPDTESTGVSSYKGYQTVFSIPYSDTLNGLPLQVTAYFTDDLAQSIVSAQQETTKTTFKYQDIFTPSSFFAGSADATEDYCSTANASKIQFRDWDDVTDKTYYVDTTAFKETVGQAVGIQYREYGMNTLQEKLVDSEGITCEPIDRLYDTEANIDTISNVAANYGIDVEEIISDKYSLLTFYDVWNGGKQIEDAEPTRIIVYTDEWRDFCSKNDGYPYNEWLFWTIVEKNAKQPTTLATYVQDKPSGVVIPWQDGLQKEEEGSEAISKMVAFSTSEVLNSTNETYKDGYTISIESDDEPGNGDVEEYVSNKNNQLIIASIGPGEYGNNIGVSIITTECADIPALNHQNAFNWKYRFDDEDKVDDPNIDPDTLTWTKVYRINVYVKTKDQTAEGAWGLGMDALLKDPIESFYVSNDPQAKDANGNSLFVPNVINGHSDYIYVSRNSVNDARTGAGTYAQPKQTYAIYQLTGGTNSKKNNIGEKTTALKLYRDRQKSDFDILFNVEAIDTFNGRQRYGAMQKKIAEIAAARKIDIGVVQVTSKESKTIKRQIGEAKMFSFNNGSYVASYGGYDKYYNGTLGSWIYLPKSVAGACAMAYCDMYAYPWMAPAGVSRGGIQYTTGQLSRLTDDEIGQLYDQNVNTSRQCGGFGEILWGQKTALKKESALNRINVRRCLNYIEKQLENMLVPYLFQQNTPNTRAAARNSIDAFMSRVQAADGVVQYTLSVTADEEDQHIMIVALRIIPAEAIEWIDVKITIDRNTGATAIEG